VTLLENMMKTEVFMAVAISLVAASISLGQVQTEVPPPLAGAKPVSVEHIKIHGTALEGNLEGDAGDVKQLV
jgi:hypothetical protein